MAKITAGGSDKGDCLIKCLLLAKIELKQKR